MMDVKLNPCPFCGEAQRDYKNHTGSVVLRERLNGSPKHNVHCDNWHFSGCGATGGAPIQSGAEEAVSAWNRRET
jgi:hypothetical protein